MSGEYKSSKPTIGDKVSILEDHFHHISKCHPETGAGTTVTGSADANALGDYAVLVATNAITSPFDIHYIGIENMSANDTYILHLYAGADGSESEIGCIRVIKTATSDPSVRFPIGTPVVAKNTQIKAKLATVGGGSDTMTISIGYHIY